MSHDSTMITCPTCAGVGKIPRRPEATPEQLALARQAVVDAGIQMQPGGILYEEDVCVLIDDDLKTFQKRIRDGNSKLEPLYMPRKKKRVFHIEDVARIYFSKKSGFESL